MKTVILVWKNNSIHSSKKCDDLFQLVKGTCFLYHLSNIHHFKLYIDTHHHSISNHVTPLPHPHQKLIADHIDNIPIVHDPEYYIQSSEKDILFFRSTTYLFVPLSVECKQLIQTILMPSNSLLLRILPIPVNRIVHVHLHESIISTSNLQHLFYIVYNKIKPYILSSTIVISDTKEFKEYIKLQNNGIVFNTRIGNIGYPLHDDSIEDTLFDLYLMTKAKKVYSFSWGKIIPGFLKILSIYNIPIEEIKN
jgi:hypothetical protein